MLTTNSSDPDKSSCSRGSGRHVTFRDGYLYIPTEEGMEVYNEEARLFYGPFSTWYPSRLRDREIKDVYTYYPIRLKDIKNIGKLGYGWKEVDNTIGMVIIKRTIAGGLKVRRNATTDPFWYEQAIFSKEEFEVINKYINS